MFEEFTELSYDEAKEYMRNERQMNQPVRAIIASNVRKIGYSVLDVGCGNGIDAKRYEKSKYLGVDISQKLIDAAKELNPGYEFRVCDARNLPFESKSFDNVICKSVLEHLPMEEIAVTIINEMFRVCKKQLQIAWHTPPHANETEIIKLKGHFGKTVYQNRYNIESIVEAFPPKTTITMYNVNGFKLWVIEC